MILTFIAGYIVGMICGVALVMWMGRESCVGDTTQGGNGPVSGRPPKDGAGA